MSAIQSNAAGVIARALEASSGAWTPDAAKALLSIKLSPADLARMNELAAKSRAGTLGVDEQIEIDSYRSAARLLELLKLHARAAIQRGGSTNPTPDLA